VLSPIHPGAKIQVSSSQPNLNENLLDLLIGYIEIEYSVSDNFSILNSNVLL
jgi:hypothetical protein